jgi:transcriptional regulator with XRE-family HTH domain
MNIEIANRLVELRKANNYSQEALAEKLGISRQAVSKWERAEASPDTDNLILLARLYGVSLDDLLKTDDEIPRPEPETGDSSADDNNEEKRRGDYVNISLKGIHVIDEDGSEVRVGWDGIHIDETKSGESVHIDKDGVFVDGVKYDANWFKGHQRQKFPMVIIIVVVYILLGAFWGYWDPGWLIFLLIPIWYTLVDAIYKKNAHIFAWPVVAALVFLILGIFFSAWHPGWVVFLSIPIYYSMVSYFRSLRRGKKVDDSDDIIDI